MRYALPELEFAFARILDGHAEDTEIREFLERSIAHMTDPMALAAGARALRARMIAVEAPADAIDVCGTGGDGAHTLNISTAVSFAVAGCGVCVAKHGNRAMSSKSGAADVLEALGVRLVADVRTIARCLTDAGIAFLFAQNHHPAMRHVAAARREIGRRTIFNLLGPLSNPAGVRRQLVGVFGPEAMRPVAEALQLLGSTHALVVHGAGGLDELSCAAGNRAVAVSVAGVGDIELDAARVGLRPWQAADVRGGDAAANADHLTRLLGGELEGGAYEAFVALNAGAALMTAGRTQDLAEGVSLALASLRNGHARHALDRVRQITNEAP